ncbi:UDP-N-acetylmuramate--L-alanine ligase [Caldanaerobius polysaccharolyticus]|uniref:UDP-N-acetylmuramate--L-alanine ligase n=1 Tax=Caldanaerobius polysaccharolyticus TaxID=44256 RepID=UPI00047AE83B|nr:UDP-N-acetylmuramate--L-alanine ligase [Caldanaerobius polysaccharolyticus]
MSIDLSKCKNIHMVGIGGISMSGLAQILNKEGFNVTGCDMKLSKITDKLEKDGITVYPRHDAFHVLKADLVVHTAAVKSDNTEILKAKELGIPVIDRAELLGLLMKNYSYGIAVSGCHGKTTTTSMLAITMQQAELDPTVLLGGEIDDIGGNVRLGNSPYFLTEACEYYDSFLKFFPYMAIVLNIDSDHLDYFKDINHIKESFLKFTLLVPQNGYIIACNDNEHVRDILKKVNNRNIITYGIDRPADYTAQDIVFNSNGHPEFHLYYKGKNLGKFKLSIPGKHNVYNALATIAASIAMGINIDIVKKAIKDFRGTHRRFEYKGNLNGISVIDDYAHHPTEIKATLKAALNYPHNRILCVFQPHTFSRTKALLYEFSQAFDCADHVIVTDIYAAREKDNGIVNSKMLVDLLRERGIEAEYLKTFEEVVNSLKKNATKGDIIMTMGAGDVYKVGEMYLNSCDSERTKQKIS